uniref:Uncharacterized protein n=1 Tax=Hucho hucho TaxID=62062 RepID=A0A4W5JKX9_9TELE
QQQQWRLSVVQTRAGQDRHVQTRTPLPDQVQGDTCHQDVCVDRSIRRGHAGGGVGRRWWQKTVADSKRQEVVVLDSKRSNAINIGLTVLPPPRTIKTAILNFDEYALNKEGIEVRDDDDDDDSGDEEDDDDDNEGDDGGDDDNEGDDGGDDDNEGDDGGDEDDDDDNEGDDGGGEDDGDDDGDEV